jgi:hypothetical protein
MWDTDIHTKISTQRYPQRYPHKGVSIWKANVFSFLQEKVIMDQKQANKNAAYGEKEA